MDEKWIKEAETTPVPAARGSGRAGGAPAEDEPGGGSRGAAAAFRQKLSEFMAAEGALAIFERGSDSDMAAGGSDLTWQQQRPDGGTILSCRAGAARRESGNGRTARHARSRTL
jgi:hypothetical protein